MARLRLCIRSCSRLVCWQQWRMWCKPLIAMVYLVTLLVVLPLMIFYLYKNGAQDQFKAWFVAGVFVLLTLPIFLVGLMQHLFNYTKPHLQSHIIRILWIVPIYSLNSWFGLLVPNTAIYWDTVKECYEAYVLYSFLCYLLNYLESEYDFVSELEALYPIKPPPPCCCCPPWPKGKKFIFWSKFGTLQYTVMRLIISLISLITQLSGVYHKGKIRLDGAWLYLAIANAISQMIAIHSLIYFYKGTRKLLGPIRPVFKFLSIKAIIFAIFWQSVLIALLVKLGALPEEWKNYQINDVTEGLQNFIICVEMLLFAVAHYFVFSHKPFIDPAAARAPCLDSCLRMLDIRDVAGDVREHFVDPIPRPRLPHLPITHRNSRSSSVENAPLLANQPHINEVLSSESVSTEQKRPRFRAGHEASSDFSIVSYQELDPKKPFGRMSTVKQEDDNTCSSSDQDSTTNNS